MRCLHSRIVIFLLLVSVFHLRVEAQSPPLGIRDSIVTDHTLGISFLQIGSLTGSSSGGYTIVLQSASGSIRQATVQLSVSPKPFIELPGSYGGRKYIGDKTSRPLLKNVVAIDSVPVNGVDFRREYWVVYAGMGMWEGIVNCYASVRGQYYELSLNTGIAAGKPGEVFDGTEMRASDLALRVANILRDENEMVIRQFNTVLSSLKLTVNHSTAPN